MKVWFQKNYKTIIISAFLIPIVTVAIVSISHVTRWYTISNPGTWAIYLSVGIEIAALSSLAALSVNMGRKVYFPFFIVTLIQFIGNVFFSYSFIDVTGAIFKSWVELVSPLLNIFGVDPTDIPGHKRFLAFFAGGMLPVISLSFLHMLIKFTEAENEKEATVTQSIETQEEPQVDAKDIISEVSRVRLTEEELAELEKRLLKPSDENISETEEKSSDDETLDEFNDTLSPIWEEPITSYTEDDRVEIPEVGEEEKIAKDDEVEEALEEVQEYIPTYSDEEIREMVLDEMTIKTNVSEIEVPVPNIIETVSEPIDVESEIERVFPTIDEPEVIVEEEVIVNEIKPEPLTSQMSTEIVDEKKN